MPRIARKNSKSCFYHVIVQGINKEYIFRNDEDIKHYKQIIISKLKESNIEILAYCIMNNHTHLLIYSERSQYLSKYMQKVNISYSQYYNKKNKRVGYVFRDRYYSQDIVNERQLYTCMKYIHNNPVKAKIVNVMQDYKYSSYNEFNGNKEVITEKGIKILFGTIKEYHKEFDRIHNEKKETEEFYDIKEKDIYEFINEIEHKYGKKIKEVKKDKELLKEIIQLARKETDVTIAELAEIMGVSKSLVGNYSKK